MLPCHSEHEQPEAHAFGLLWTKVFNLYFKGLQRQNARFMRSQHHPWGQISNTAYLATGCHYVSSGQLSKKTHYWTCWSLTTWSHTSVAEKEMSNLEILFSSLMSGSSFEKPNSRDQPFYLSSLCNSRWKEYMLGLPSLSLPHPWLQMPLMRKEG